MATKPLGLAASAFINDGNDRFLTLRRSRNSKFFRGQWEVPGGKIDAGESLDDALLREVGEETSLTVVLDRVVGVSEFELPHIRVAMLYFAAHTVGGQVRLSEEHEAYVWLPVSEMLRLDLTAALRDVLVSTQWQ